MEVTPNYSCDLEGRDDVDGSIVGFIGVQSQAGESNQSQNCCLNSFRKDLVILTDEVQVKDIFLSVLVGSVSL